ncbi:potassium-transporting ATPase subunit KdpC [Sebaldella sp. S0638]|uniref:potassium-transporting ATPase subunit KdpC n=1 Tax=Sebaldella sp. S0638 TaxID=2957809 RepID=UPI00209DC108|nr:potassium-transporting ATPase subunit KdpC [Sebaldella sp. S0638]MCP1224822.1 potassium-transporting ATPase subunit KdpC [Sebaldella sp. S0638]
MKILRQSFMITLIFIILCGFIYPVVINGIAAIFFKNKAEGSLITYNGEVVGSRLIGQEFTSPEFFHGRVSAVNYSTGEDENLTPKSGGSNLAVSNPALKERIQSDLEKFLKENPAVKKDEVPAELLTASGSGLDPDISVESAVIQADRVAKANNLSKDEVLKLINDSKKGNLINVLELNLNLLKMK